MIQRLKRLTSHLCIVLLGLLLLPHTISAQETGESTEEETEMEAEPVEPMVDPGVLANSFLQDRNGNEVLDVVAFGDSLTRGVGDFISSDSVVTELQRDVEGEAGYPLRLELTLNVPVSNSGNPGEELVQRGVKRFAQTIPSLNPDVVIVSEGANDAIFLESSTAIFRAMQTIVNISYAVGAQPVLATITPSCCDRAGRNQFVDAYNQELRSLAAANDLPIADVNKAFKNVCGSTNCFLLNRPEGLHPNSEGYDIFGETVLAALLKIDLFAPDGPQMLEQALNLPEGSVRTVPDPAPEE